MISGKLETETGKSLTVEMDEGKMVVDNGKFVYYRHRVQQRRYPYHRQCLPAATVGMVPGRFVKHRALSHSGPITAKRERNLKTTRSMAYFRALSERKTSGFPSTAQINI